MFKRLAFDNFVLIAQYAVNALIPLLLIPHIVRELGLTAYGSLAVTLAWANYGLVIVQYAFQYTGPQRLARLRAGETEKSVVYRVASAKITLFAGVMSLLGLLGIATMARDVPLSLGEVTALVCLPMAGAMHTGWHLQAIGQFVAVGIVSVLGILAALVVGFGFVRSGHSTAPLAAATALVIGPLVAGFGTLLLSARMLATQTPKAGWQPPWRELYFGWPLFASQFTAALYGLSGPIIVGSLAGIAQAGAYSAVERIAGAISAACLLTHTAAYPKLARLYRTDRSSYAQLLGVVIGTYLIVVAGITGAVLSFWNPTLQFLFGTQAEGQGPLLTAGLVWLTLGVFGTVYTGYLTVSGNGNAVLPLNLRILGLSLCLGIPGVIAFGAWAWMAALAASQVLILADVWRSWTLEARKLPRVGT